MATAVSMTSSTDRRESEPHLKPIWKLVARGTWASGDTAAVTLTLPNLNGIINGISIKNSNATNAITVSVSLTDEQSGVYPNITGLAENASHVKTAPTNFDEISVNGDYTLTITPSGDPGASGLIVDVEIRGV